MPKRSPADDRGRSLLAQECAKIIATEGIKDFAKAKRKAVGRLGLSGSRNLLPSNVEIEHALLCYQRLFFGDEQAAHLFVMRQAALQVMNILAQFRPKLVGAVLNGTAGLQSAVELHVFANTPEDVIFFMIDSKIEHTSGTRRMRLQNNKYAAFPTVGFEVNDISIDLTTFWQRSERDIPYSPIDGKPMKRANRRAVEQLIGHPSEFSDSAR